MQSFIEVQFPVSKISKESYKERKAGQSQTLTGLGKWWGRKPLILVRATILGLLMPASNDPVKDRDIFLKILMMDPDGVWNRKNKAIKDEIIIENLTFRELKTYFEVPLDLFAGDDVPQDKLIKKALKDNISRIKWRKSLSKLLKEKATKIAFNRMSYDDRLEYCIRPEETLLKNMKIWAEINLHLGTKVETLVELMRELGIKKFGYVPTVGDCFAGGGSIPFEAARIGLNAYASDLNPLAGLLTWAGLNLLSLPESAKSELNKNQKKIFDEVAQYIDEIGIEENEKGWRAKYYLYCYETECPECNTIVPLSPSWVISQKHRTVGLLEYNSKENNFKISIKSNATKEEIALSESQNTIVDYALKCPKCNSVTPIPLLRKDQKGENWNEYRYSTKNNLRLWRKSDFTPQTNDIFKERLYCIQYEDIVFEKNKKRIFKYFIEPDRFDIIREQKVIDILANKFRIWQDNGILPEDEIRPGWNTNQVIYERGWKYWHHLSNPRQLLNSGLLVEKTLELSTDNVDKSFIVNSVLSLNAVIDRSSKLCRWDTGGDKGQQVYYNQALNTIFNYATRSLSTIRELWISNIDSNPFERKEISVDLIDARNVNKFSNFWITDPPYADAVNYHELSEFFLSWDKELIKKSFPEWYTDSKRVLAVKGTGESFNKSMIEIYRNLANHMPEDGMQVVMFTHQSPAVWADLTLILWSAGLHVTAAWNIATETESGGIKEGNYVKGTVLLVLRKLTSEMTAFTDTIAYEIQEEVKLQIDSMRSLEDKDDPNFSDADYLLAAYAATLKVLTGYQKIGDINVEYELSKPNDNKSIGPVEAIINSAIRTAYDYLIPQSFDSYIWKNLSAEERFFIKGMELEKSNVYQLGAYQEMARGFGVKDFKDMLASTKANTVRFKTPSEFGNRWLRGTDAFGNTLLRQVLMAIAQGEKEQNAQSGRAWLKNEVENYWDSRQTIIELLRYLSTTEHIDHMQNWESSALYAKYLVELVSNDGV